MTDPLVLAPTTVLVPPAPTPVKSGWKSSEGFAAMIALGAIGFALERILEILPAIAANPALPPWATPILAIAPIGLGWLMKKVAQNYGEIRRDLKIDASATLDQSQYQAAVAAGVAQAVLPAGSQINKINQ